MTEGSDSKCCDRRKQNINFLPSSIKQHIRPLAKIPLSQRRILLVLPHWQSKLPIKIPTLRRKRTSGLTVKRKNHR